MENKGSRDSVVSIVTRLRTRRSEVRILTGAIDLSLFLKVQFGMGFTQPALQSTMQAFSQRLRE
jgi:hypothetical protein